MARQGKCTNFGNCANANSRETIEITGQLFDCPECGLPLVQITKGLNKKWLLALIPLVIFVGGGVAISGFLMILSVTTPLRMVNAYLNLL